MKAPPEAVLAHLRWYVARYGYAPTMREIARALGVATSTVAVALDRLELADAIERDPERARAIRIMDDPFSDAARRRPPYGEADDGMRAD